MMKFDEIICINDDFRCLRDPSFLDASLFSLYSIVPRSNASMRVSQSILLLVTARLILERMLSALAYHQPGRLTRKFLTTNAVLLDLRARCSFRSPAPVCDMGKAGRFRCVAFVEAARVAAEPPFSDHSSLLD